MFEPMYPKALIIVFLTFLLTSSTQLLAQSAQQSDGDTRYIVDDLITYLHAGPGRNYRILGSLVAGSKVTQLQIDSEAGFVEIIDDRQRTGWIDAQFVSEKISIRELVPSLQSEIETVNSELSLRLTENERLSQQISELTSKSSQLNSELQSLQQSNSQLRKELAQKDQSAQMQWLLRGGGIALVSILLGVLLTYLPKKKRRNDQWM